MYLTACHFDGNPAELMRGHDRLPAAIPAENVDLHVVVVGEAGITILDACPSRAVFEKFSSSPGFRAALSETGLPSPRIEPLGDIAAPVKVSTEVPR